MAVNLPKPGDEASRAWEVTLPQLAISLTINTDLFLLKWWKFISINENLH